MAKHVWELDEEGNIEIWGDEHAGPTCAVCGASKCESCSPGFRDEECPVRAVQDCLPGLDWEDAL